MSMTPIVSGGLTFMLPFSAMKSVLTTDVLYQDFADIGRSFSDAAVSLRWRFPSGGGTLTEPTPSLWAQKLLSGTANGNMCPSISPDHIIAILREALIGGGMTTLDATDAAERIYRAQFNQSVSNLAAQIVQACIAAG